MGMLKARQRPSSGGTVIVLSNNAETLKGMNRYFTQTGIASLSRQTLNPLAELASTIHALVVFPDDFAAHAALSYLSMVRTRRPDLSVVIVTKSPATYTTMTSTDGHPLDAIVLPRPAFGWTILDAFVRPQSPVRHQAPEGYQRAFAASNALRRTLLDDFAPSRYVPGCPPHPLTLSVAHRTYSTSRSERGHRNDANLLGGVRMT
jgi:hypothetical protein